MFVRDITGWGYYTIAEVGASRKFGALRKLVLAYVIWFGVQFTSENY